MRPVFILLLSAALAISCTGKSRDLTRIGMSCTEGACPRGLQCSRTSSYAHLPRAATCQVLCNFNDGECPDGWSCNLGEHGPAPDDAGGYCAPLR